ncbi:site-specific integrase [Cupriavidus basilensis]|uniref:Site-specific integrase n=1 Tax=Cupriavidus basilensis TaxID=68895 RepID=A0ABT6AY96_9BURK|nr:site-specific integrase [Cupriavidus basilensis]MDF3837600.1 site-specific integrase [Cupriavidus basilensis]
MPKIAKPEMDTGRGLREAQWAFVTSRLAALEPSSANRHLQVVLPLPYSTGLRLSETVSLTTSDLEWVSLPHPGTREREEGWWLTMLGKHKHSKVRRVPVPNRVVAALSQYLVARGFAADPRDQREPVALLVHATDTAARAPWLKFAGAGAAAPLQPGTLYRQVKRFFQACARELTLVDARGAERLAAASTHWLRHTHISHGLVAGVPIEVMQQNAGHDSLATTTRYVTTEDARRMASLKRFLVQTESE